jgi:hypothetical protein
MYSHHRPSKFGISPLNFAINLFLGLTCGPLFWLSYRATYLMPFFYFHIIYAIKMLEVHDMPCSHCIITPLGGVNRKGLRDPRLISRRTL